MAIFSSTEGAGSMLAVQVIKERWKSVFGGSRRQCPATGHKEAAPGPATHLVVPPARVPRGLASGAWSSRALPTVPGGAGGGRGPHRHAHLYKHTCTCLPLFPCQNLFSCYWLLLSRDPKIFPTCMCSRAGKSTRVCSFLVTAARLSPGGWAQLSEH